MAPTTLSYQGSSLEEFFLMLFRMIDSLTKSRYPQFILLTITSVLFKLLQVIPPQLLMVLAEGLLMMLIINLSEAHPHLNRLITRVRMWVHTPVINTIGFKKLNFLL